MTSLSQQRRAPVISTAAIGLASLIAALPLEPVYGTWVLWLATAAIASLGGAAIATLSRSTALPVPFVLMLASQCVVGPVITQQETTLWHVIPTWDTVSLGVERSVTAFKHVLTMTPPVGTAEGSLMTTWTLVLWCSFLAVSLAQVSPRWARVTVCLTILGELGCSALLGTSEGFVPATVGTGLALVMVMWASWDCGLLDPARWVTIFVIVSLALASGIATRYVPSGRFVLRDLYRPPVTMADQASPLSRMRAFVKDHKADDLLTVIGLPEQTPLRLAVMDTYDGIVWNLSATSGSGTFRQGVTSVSTEPNGTKYTATVETNEDLGLPWLPLAGKPTAIEVQTDDTAPVFFNLETDTALLDTETSSSVAYTVRGILTPTASTSDIARARADRVKQPTPQEVPEALVTLAHMWAGSGVTDGQMALNLSRHLHDEGWFSHGLTTDYPSPPGHGASRMSLLVDGGTMVGDSEQYASALALMTRVMGIPSRVVMGFVPKGPSGEMSARRTRQTRDGRQTTFTGNDSEAWVEVKLDALGWVPLFPTPDETKTVDESQHSISSQPQDIARQPGVPLTDSPREERFVPGTSLESPDESRYQQSPWERAAPALKAIMLYGSPVWALMVIVLVLIGLRAANKWRRKCRGSAQQRVLRGWDYLMLLSQWKGGRKNSDVRASQARVSQARTAETELGLAPSSLTPLQRLADSAAFGPQKVSTATSTAVWEHIENLEKTVHSSASFRQRLRLKLSLRGLYRTLSVSIKKGEPVETGSP